MAQPGLSLHEGERRFVDYHRRRDHSRRTLEHYQDSVAVFRKYLAAKKKPQLVGLLTTSVLADFHTWLERTPLDRPYRGSTARTVAGIHGVLRDLRAFAYWLVEEELLEKPPKVALPKLPDEPFVIFTDQELVRLFSVKQLAGDADGAVRNRAIVSFFLDTGVRLAELSSLLPDDLYLDDRMARIHGKGSKVRHVFFTDGTARYLEEWLTLRDPEETPLFGLSYHGVKMLMRRLSRESGLDVHAHKFRHTSATMMVQGEMDLHAVRRTLGHSTLAVTEKYLSLSNEDLRRKHAAASPMARLQPQLSEPPPKPTRRRYRGA